MQDKSQTKEVGTLFHIYGAVDQHVEANPDRREQVRPLLPSYGRPRAHWFRRYAKTTGLTDLEKPETRVSNALTALAQSKPRGRMRARRLLAVSAAAQAFPELSDQDLAAAAVGPGQQPDVDELVRLLKAQPRDSQSGRDERWTDLAESKETPNDLGPRPCSGALAWVTVDGDTDLVPTLKTVLEVEIPFVAASDFCHPESWRCYPMWCGMKELDEEKDGITKYQELVSFDCTNEAWPKLQINLNFAIGKVEGDPPNRHILTEYWLSDDQPKDQSVRDPVSVNQGWLEVQELSGDPARVRVTTTKTVKFRDDLGGPGLASVLCRLGYLSMVGDLVTCASRRRGEEKEYPNAPFPKHLQPEDPHGTAQSQGLDYGELTRLMAIETANAAQDSIDEYVRATQTTYANAGPGYSAEDLVQDVGDPLLRALRAGAKAVDQGLYIGRTRTTPRRGKP